MRTSDDPTVVVELTPPGRAAVAVVAVAGPTALAAIRHCFLPATPWRENVPPMNRIMTGRWGGECGEELVVCRRGDDEFEIHCHGGAAAAAAIEQQLVALGCIRVNWREFVSSSSGHTSRKREPRAPRDLEPIRKPSAEAGQSQFAPQTPQIWDSPRRFSDRLLVTAAARVALAEAATARTARVLLDQYHGALSDAVDAARAAAAASDVLLARKTIDSILEFGELGLHLSTPWRVVIAGPPNVGKSSLLNAIAGFQRAIVSPVPGTTRDIVSITTALHGWPVEFADTAGLRETCDELESTGVALADAALQHADAVIVVADASAAAHDSTGVFSRVPAGARVIHVVNKIDLVDASDAAAARFAQHIDDTTHCASALTGIGIAELLAAVESLLVPVSPASGAAVPFTPGQIRALESARAAIERMDMAKADALLASVLGIT